LKCTVTGCGTNFGIGPLTNVYISGLLPKKVKYLPDFLAFISLC